MDLQQVINKASTRFVTDVMEAIRSVPLSELLESRPDAAPAVAKKKAGRPKKVAVVKPAKKAAAKVPKVKKAKKHSYPKCSVPGCKNTMWARGEGMCGEHFKAAKTVKLIVKKPVVKKAKKVKAPKTPKPAKAAKPKKEPKSKMAPMGRDAAIAKSAAAETPKE